MYVLYRYLICSFCYQDVLNFTPDSVVNIVEQKKTKCPDR
ncbi:hypothetical protein SLPHG_CDS0050 [Salmonella phage Sephi301i]